MNRIFSLATVVALGIAFVAVGFGPATVTAQSAGNQSDTDEMAQSVDSDVNLTDWSYADGTFTMHFEQNGRSPTLVTFTESTQPEEGTQRFAVQRERLEHGTHTITMQTKIENGESAVGITTAESIRNGHGVVISTGNSGRNPFAPFGGTSGLLSGVGLSVVLSGGAAAWVIWREQTGVIEA